MDMGYFAISLLVFVLPQAARSVANFQEKQNLIGEEDRRAAETVHIDDKVNFNGRDPNKRGLLLVPVPKYHYQDAGSDYDHGYGHGYLYEGHYDGGHGFHGSTSGFGGLNSFNYHPPIHHGNSFDYHHEEEHDDHHHHHEVKPHDKGHSIFGLKSLLIPLAGIALLGAAAAALSANPVLLQLGVLNGRRRRRRRRGATPSPRYFSPENMMKRERVYPANPLVKPRNARAAKKGFD